MGQFRLGGLSSLLFQLTAILGQDPVYWIPRSLEVSTSCCTENTELYQMMQECMCVSVCVCVWLIKGWVGGLQPDVRPVAGWLSGRGATLKSSSASKVGLSQTLRGDNPYFICILLFLPTTCRDTTQTQSMNSAWHRNKNWEATSLEWRPPFKSNTLGSSSELGNDSIWQWDSKLTTKLETPTPTHPLTLPSFLCSRHLFNLDRTKRLYFAFLIHS